MYDFMDMGFDEPNGNQAAGNGPYIPEAVDCMRCGMCVGACPTFRLFQVEEETPRRRIRTLSKLLVENQPVTQDEQGHLQNCLQCRACEAVCPSHMAYGELFDASLGKRQNRSGWLVDLAFRFIENKSWRSAVLPLLYFYQKSGLQKPIRNTGLLEKMGLGAAEALLTEPALQALATCHPPPGEMRGRVALFTGCLAGHFDRATHLAAIRLLNAVGYEVLVPDEQGCCGAIHQHNGRSAAELVENNIAVFNALPVQAVLHAASGCGVMLSEYQGRDTDAAEKFRQRLSDINQFLVENWPEGLPLQPAALQLAVHEPCSQRNVLKNQQSVYSLLQKIPEASVAALTDNQLCCGAGGSYMLSHPENAGQLRELKRQAISAAQADHIISSNYGCAVFLSSEQYKLIHPLVLVAGQLLA